MQLADQKFSLEQQLLNGHNQLRFQSNIEPLFIAFQAQIIQKRALILSSFCLLLLALYAGIDYLFLPENVWQFTIFVRAVMLAPAAIVMAFLIQGQYQPKTVFTVALLSYLWVGFGIVIIIAGSQLNGYDLPYEGLYSVIPFSFLLLGLPFRLALYGSWGLIAAYGITESVIGYTQDLIVQLFFLSSMCAIASLGGYIQEHFLRTGFLKHQLLRISRKQALEDTNAKSQFLAAAGHDLRQPINAIGLLSEALAKTSKDETQHSLTDKLENSVGLLNRLLNSLLEYSRLELKEVTAHPEQFDIRQFLIEIVERFEVSLKDKHLKIELADLDPEDFQPLIVNSDPLLLERIVQNLLSNIETHAQASQITITCGRTYNPNRITLLISDNGCGIPAEHQQAIFEQYFQVKQNRENGMGLGLNIVKQLCTLLNIQLSVKSVVSKGTTFELGLDPET